MINDDLPGQFFMIELTGVHGINFFMPIASTDATMPAVVPSDEICPSLWVSFPLASNNNNLLMSLLSSCVLIRLTHQNRLEAKELICCFMQRTLSLCDRTNPVHTYKVCLWFAYKVSSGTSRCYLQHHTLTVLLSSSIFVLCSQ